MANPYIGEIRLFGGNFAPLGWAFCNGQLVAIAENDALFSLIGTTYGGDGQTTFALPNLQGRVPVHQGQGPGLSNCVMGQLSGTETVTLTASQLPSHVHVPSCNSSIGTSADPTNNYWAAAADLLPYTDQPPNVSNATASPTGGSQPHDNMLPFLTVSFIISLFGIFPSPN